MRCSRIRIAPRHDECVVAKIRVEHGVDYRCACSCGEEWSIGVCVSDKVADELVPRPDERLAGPHQR